VKLSTRTWRLNFSDQGSIVAATLIPSLSAIHLREDISHQGYKFGATFQIALRHFFHMHGRQKLTASKTVRTSHLQRRDWNRDVSLLVVTT
jgi:hypothetical protein